jgi:ribonuclease HI
MQRRKAETVRLLSGLDPGSPIVYCDGGTDGNGANGECGASGYGVCVTRKKPDWTPEGQPHIEDHYFGPVIIDPTDIYWLGANRGTNNTGELSGFATALLHLQADGGHETAAIC